MNSYNDPLLFIKGPPVFHSPFKVREENHTVDAPMDVPKEIQDESTSIYEIRTSMSPKTVAIVEKLKFLTKPFQRRVYRPLVFHLEEGVLLQGEVEKVDNEFVTFFLGAGELITYRVDQVERIVWRGVEMN